MSKSKKQALLEWESYVGNIKKSRPVDLSESETDKSKRVQMLLKDYDAFFKYYFPQYASYQSAEFHHRYAKKFLGGKFRGTVMTQEPPSDYKIYISRAWARDHGKTTFTQLLIIYALVKGLIKNVIYASKTVESADDMVKLIRKQLENNPRLINDFGEFKSVADWTNKKFVTKTGLTVRSLGRGQSPRGTKEEEVRPDCIICDDLDDDELVRSASRLEKEWDWLNSALFPCMSIKGGKRFIVLNNKIADDSLLVRASEMADNHEQINIYDKKGNPSWSERFDKEECQWMIDKIGTHFAQKEYFNNPIIAGKVFKNDWIQYKKLPPLNKYKYLVAYLDPSFSSKKTADHKALVLIGLLDGEYHVHKAYCSIGSVNEMIEWHYDLDTYVKSKNAVCQFWMEDVFLQSLLYTNFSEVGKAKGYAIPVRGDKRKKPDKDARISALSGLFERDKWFFNIEDKANHHLDTLTDQFKLFEAGKNGIAKDGADACEGAKYLLEKMVFTSQPAIVGKRKPKKNAW